MKSTQTSAKSTSAADEKHDGFTDEERGAMKERAKELRTAARRSPRAAKADAESEVLAKIAEMPEADRVLAERLHDIVKAGAPDLSPRLWYGMPAYAKNGKVVCFFQSAQKFKTRYATLGFSDQAALDEGTMWPTTYALTELTAADEARIGELIKKAAS
ncbi:iron chaperone [Streptomyces sp. NPDC057565]|uniref:iron chaperone n=1 Tax=Streptomyces sp. NPDC057565 TaxID=3346169 RepID=UPI0036B8AC8F